jgi:hypothetical protein
VAARVAVREPVIWNASGRPSTRERDQLAVENHLPAVEPPDRADDLRDAAGDVVQSAGVDGHLVAVAVHLDPDAVQLPLSAAVRRSCASASATVCRRLREHRWTPGPPAGRTGQPGLASVRTATANRCRCSAQHGGGADLVERDASPCRPRRPSRVESALAQLTADQ